MGLQGLLKNGMQKQTPKSRSQWLIFIYQNINNSSHSGKHALGNTVPYHGGGCRK